MSKVVYFIAESDLKLEKCYGTYNECERPIYNF